MGTRVGHVGTWIDLTVAGVKTDIGVDAGGEDVAQSFGDELGAGRGHGGGGGLVVYRQDVLANGAVQLHTRAEAI